MAEIDYDPIKDDICYGCRYSSLKKNPGYFERRYNCVCGKRIDEDADKATKMIGARRFNEALAIVSRLYENWESMSRRGYMEPTTDTIACPFKKGGAK